MSFFTIKSKLHKNYAEKNIAFFFLYSKQKNQFILLSYLYFFFHTLYASFFCKIYAFYACNFLAKADIFFFRYFLFLNYFGNQIFFIARILWVSRGVVFMWLRKCDFIGNFLIKIDIFGIVIYHKCESEGKNCVYDRLLLVSGCEFELWGGKGSRFSLMPEIRALMRRGWSNFAKLKCFVCCGWDLATILCHSTVILCPDYIFHPASLKSMNRFKFKPLHSSKATSKLWKPWTKHNWPQLQ